MTTYAAITIWQPWATLIAKGFKPYEFRGWPAPKAHRGCRVAIHAGARPVKRSEVAELILKLRNPRTAAVTGLIRHNEALALLERIHTAPTAIPLASVICTAILGEPIRNAELAARLGLPWANDSDREEHYGWPLTDIRPVRPIVPARGRQGWWSWNAAGPGR